MSALRNTVILASAGTGKTFALSGHYLRLLLAGCPPESILATTFTRKAAGEIIDRVLLRLARAADDQAECDRLGFECGVPILTPSHCQRTLARLVERFDRVNIGTLDALFGRMAAAFRFESGSTADRMVTEAEDDEFRERAMLDALEQLPREHLLSTIRSLFHGEPRSSVLGPLRCRARELQGVLAASSPNAWGAIAPTSSPLGDDALNAVLAGLERVELPLTKQGKENSRWRNAVAKSIASARGADWTSVLSVGIGNVLARGASEYNGTPVSEQVRNAYALLVEHARSILLTQLRTDTLATREFVARFSAQYDLLKHRAGVATFDDVPRSLLAADACGDLEHLYYRLDSRIDHLLVDEFQDTSAVQFQLLRRLIDEITQDNEGRRSFFAVGDVKQSLYQWRDATPRLLLELPTRLSNITQERLDRNYRSSTSVLQAVNKVFGSLPTSSVLGKDEAGRAAAELWDRTFRAHTGLDQVQGFVSLRTAPQVKGTPGATDAKLRAAARRAAELHGRDPSLSIGVLFQTRKHIAPTVAALRELGIDASREGGSALTDSPTVSLAISAVRLAEHPGDSAAHFHLAHSALAAHLGLSPENEPSVRQAAADLRARFMHAGFARTLSGFLAAMDGRCSDVELARFEQLIDLANKYDHAAAPTLSGFERIVRGTRVQSPSSASARVMTIHGAKGLEFDSVILADLDDNLLGRTRDLFAIERSGADDTISAVCRVSPIANLLHPRLAAVALDSNTRRYHERLCVLYVAMTRARASLDMIINAVAPSNATPSADPPDTPSTFAGLLRESLAPNGIMSTDRTLWQCGNEDSIRSALDSADRSTGRREPRPIRLRTSGRTPTFALPRRSPSSSDTEAMSMTPFESKRSAATARGRIFHAWFEAIEWLDTFQPSAAWFHEIARRSVVRSPVQSDEQPGEMVARWADEFCAALRAPNIVETLSKRSTSRRLGSSELTVRREHRITARDTDPDTGAESLLSGQIDRLVLARREGVVVAAEVLDFKTDAADADVSTSMPNNPTAHGSSATVKRHASQLLAYRRSVASVFRLSVGSVRASVFLVSSDTRIDLA